MLRHHVLSVKDTTLKHPDIYLANIEWTSGIAFDQVFFSLARLAGFGARP